MRFSWVSWFPARQHYDFRDACRRAQTLHSYYDFLCPVAPRGYFLGSVACSGTRYGESQKPCSSVAVDKHFAGQASEKAACAPEHDKGRLMMVGMVLALMLTSQVRKKPQRLAVAQGKNRQPLTEEQPHGPMAPWPHGWGANGGVWLAAAPIDSLPPAHTHVALRCAVGGFRGGRGSARCAA